MELDMTRGKPLGLIWRFMVPVLIGGLFLQLYNTTDTMIVGRFVGLDALAAVGAAATVMELIIGFGRGMTGGFTVLTAQCFGAGEEEKMRQSIGNAVTLTLIAVVFMTAGSLWGLDWLLEAMRTPEEMFVLTRQYLVIICGGMACQLFSSLLGSILQAVGNSKTPLAVLLVSSGINIVLDLILVCLAGMGIRGAAAATIFAQGVSGAACALYIRKKIPLLHIGFRHFRLKRECVQKQLASGLPMALQYSVTAVGSLFIQVALNGMGASAVGAYTASYRILQVIMEFQCALGITMSTYAAQNRGKGELGRIVQGTRTAMGMLCVYSVAAYGVLLAGKNVFIDLFLTQATEQVYGYASTYLVICGAFLIPLGMIFLYRNVLQGCGYAVFSTIGGVLELVSRAVVAFAAVYYGSYVGACFSNVIAWVSAGGFLWLSYLYLIKRKAGRTNA